MKENSNIKFLFIVLMVECIFFYCYLVLEKFEKKLIDVEYTSKASIKELDEYTRWNMNSIDRILVNHADAIKRNYAEIIKKDSPSKRGNYP